MRLLWSRGPEESAGLLADLARLEQRKGQGITVPLEVKGQHKQQALQLYSSLPSVNYAHALCMSHNFSSIAQLMNRFEKNLCSNSNKLLLDLFFQHVLSFSSRSPAALLKRYRRAPV